MSGAGAGNPLQYYSGGRIGQMQRWGHPRDLIGGGGGLVHTIVAAVMDLPNRFMRPSAASRKETVSTPSAVIGTFANDCCR